jgi:holo-[acyl-carrier protein] synthase
MDRIRRGGNSTPSPVPRIGCDLAEVSAVAESIAHFGERYLRRVFTETERQQAGEVAERLAVRFAAKEAVLKVLRNTAGVTFQQIEIVNDADGAPQVQLTMNARKVADDQRLGPIAISVSHERGFALATAIAMTNNLETTQGGIDCVQHL